MSTPIPPALQPHVTIQAEDRTACQVEGESTTRIYPRTVGMEVLWFTKPGSSVTVSGSGRAIYLLLPPVFISPGPYYGALGSGKLRYRIDNRPWQTIDMLTAGRDVILAEGLTAGKHTVRVEHLSGQSALDAFHFAPETLSYVGGHITADDFSELLTDVRADVFLNGKLVHTSYIRNPVNGRWNLLGLRPGSYRIRFTANGWQPYEVDAAVARAGQKIDLGVIVLKADISGMDKSWYSYIGFGRTASVSPGEILTSGVAYPALLKEASLVSRFKTIPLERIETEQPAAVSTPQDAATERKNSFAFRVPRSTPHDIYALHLVYISGDRSYAMEVPQAVCVREPLPENYYIAGIGHMNTWGQQTSEYLAKVAATAELAGARHLMIANEVNALYIAGALKDLRIPYIVTNGNHTMARWGDFYSPRTFAVDDGSLRLVALNDRADRSWRDVDELLRERDSATSRVVVAYEGYMPIDLIKKSGVDILFDGHSATPHPNLSEFPVGTLQMRAPTQETMRWIAMTHNGVSLSTRSVDDVPVIEIPRAGPSPLRVEYSGANDGTASFVTARVINEISVSFEKARLRFILNAGKATVTGGRVLQSFLSDDGKLCVTDVEVAVAQKSVAVITAKSS